MSTKKIMVFAAVGVGVAAWLHFRSSIPKNAVAVKPFDIKRYLGKWYEIARIDYLFENRLNNTSAEYSLNPDGSVKVLNRGYHSPSGKWKEATGRAIFAGDDKEGKLKVSFFGPLYSGYNVIALDNNYQYALVAGRNLDYLWLLSRERTMPATIIEDYLQQARRLGYDTTKLVWVEQNS